MKAAVVGGGITGCAAALALAEAGHEVTLHETDTLLGGSLRDVRHDTGSWLRGCQYLSPHADWFARLRTRLDCEFRDFEHRYASWTNGPGGAVYRDDFALPVFGIMPRLPPGDPTSARTLAERFACYGEEIGAELSALAARFGHAPQSLAASSASAMQLAGAMVGGAPEAMRELKGRDARADVLFALPRRLRDPGAPALRATLPVGGFDAFFDAVAVLLRRSGVTLRLGSGVTARADGSGTGAFTACVGRDPLRCELTVWCCNPTPLMLAAGLGRIDSPPVRFHRLHALVEGPALESPLYVQCFDARSPVYRLYLYPDAGAPKACVECLAAESLATEVLVAEANQVLRQWAGDAALRPVHRQSDTAYILLTPHDERVFAAFETLAPRHGFVSGAWGLFGRDAKIVHLQRSLQALGALPT